MRQASLKSLFQAGIIRSISAVRSNQNGYLYCTLYSANGTTNVYFGQKSSAQVAEGMALSKDMLLNLEIVQTENKNHEGRFKLSLPKVGVSNLSSIFDETVVDFDMELFKKEFQSTPVASTTGA